MSDRTEAVDQIEPTVPDDHPLAYMSGPFGEIVTYMRTLEERLKKLEAGDAGRAP